MAASGRGVRLSESDSESNPWETNEVTSSSQRKTKNIFDDDVTLEEAKGIILNEKNDDFEDDFEEIGWNDEDLSSSRRPEEIYEAKVNIDELGTPSYTAPKPPQANTVAKNKFAASAVKTALTHSRSLSSGGTWKPVPLSENLNRGVSDPSIQEVVGLERKKSFGSNADISKLQAEIQALQRMNLMAKRDRWAKLPVVDTIKRMLKGEAYTLEFYKSLEEKLALVDGAIRVYDGNCIIATILFLKRSVKASIFNYEVSRRPVALNHYLNYLRMKMDYRELSTMLEMNGRTEEAAMLQYKIATSSILGSSKPGALRNVMRTHFSMNQQLVTEAALVSEHVDLLERQGPIEDSDAREEASGKNQMFREIPRKRSIYEMPLITTLYYCCLYHFHLSENSLASPVAIRKKHHICDKQFLYCALGAQARLRKWRTVEELLTTKGWFGGTKMKAAIGWDKVIDILNKHSAPLDMLHKYLNLIDDLELRAEVAKRNSIVMRTA